MSSSIVDWPNDPGCTWLMRCRPTRRSKWQLLVVMLEAHDSQEFVRPYGDRNCYSRSICAEWEAKFLRVEGTPEDWLAEPEQ